MRPYMRRSKSIETLLPILYLKGSNGDFSEALAALRWPVVGAMTRRGDCSFTAALAWAEYCSIHVDNRSVGDIGLTAGPAEREIPAALSQGNLIERGGCSAKGWPRLKLFERFGQHLEAKGYIARGGQMD
jgi:hypothetical protein